MFHRLEGVREEKHALRVDHLNAMKMFYLPLTLEEGIVYMCRTQFLNRG